jgi:hypothetical protein
MEKLVDLQSMATNGRRLAINRDRISLELFGNRTTIKQEYPKLDFASLSKIAGLAIGKSVVDGGSIRAYGYNVEIVYDTPSQELASKYIADRVFSDFTRNSGWNTIGGSAGIRLHDQEGIIWNIVIEPRFRDVDKTDKVFFSLNCHQEEKHIPKTPDIRASLSETLRQAKTFVNSLDA